jgi:7-keto-8-aminopelargonate synthetase-like enzyme
VFDGLYSMRGDFAPYAGLGELLVRHPQLHLYVDDAHATSCFGARGRGLALEALPDDPRVIVTLSLNKAFSAAGGAIVVSDAATKESIRLSGPTMSFSGPIQAPMLGAAVASAKLHLQPELAAFQDELLQKVLLAREVAAELGIHLIADDVTPIFMLPYEAAPQARAAVRAFWNEGFYVCPVTYPAVPISHPGVRFTICRTNSADDIRAFMTVARRLQAPRSVRVSA